MFLNSCPLSVHRCIWSLQVCTMGSTRRKPVHQDQPVVVCVCDGANGYNPVSHVECL